MRKIGQTDSETMFLLALTFGLEEDAARGIGHDRGRQRRLVRKAASRTPST